MFECDSENHIYALQLDADAEYNHIIFSNAGASQTADLDMGQVGYLYNPETNQWTLYQEGIELPVEKTPVIKASVESSEFKGSMTVTFSVENAKKATIQVNGTTETFTDSITKTFTDTAEVNIEAVNETKSATKSYKYTKIQEQQSETITIYFTNNQNWNDVYAYTLSLIHISEPTRH